MEGRESTKDKATDCSIQTGEDADNENLFQLGGIVFEMVAKPFGQFKQPKTFQRLKEEHGIYPQKKPCPQKHYKT